MLLLYIVFEQIHENHAQRTNKPTLPRSNTTTSETARKFL